jgi:hypothetical protein
MEVISGGHLLLFITKKRKKNPLISEYISHFQLINSEFHLGFCSQAGLVMLPRAKNKTKQKTKTKTKTKNPTLKAP